MGHSTSFARAVVLDVDDTVDVVHGHQQLRMERPFLPIHVYDAVRVLGCCDPAPRQDAVGCGGSQASSRLGIRHWPHHITIRGDGHYGREEAMTWCENYGIDYIFGLSGNVVLDRLVEAAADDIRVRRAVNQAGVLRGFAETRYAAKSWDKERRVVAGSRPAPADDMLRRGIDIRYVVTSLRVSVIIPINLPSLARAERTSVPRKNSPSDHASACIRRARNHSSSLAQIGTARSEGTV